MKLVPIGVIHTPFKKAEGTPLQPRSARDATGTVEVFEAFSPGLKDLDGFDRIWLIYWFDRAAESELVAATYLDQTPHGVFATRLPARPNPIGMSSVKLLGMEKNVLRVGDIDVLDKTPLLDIKPYSPNLDSFEVDKSGWLDRFWEEKDVGYTAADERFINKEHEDVK